jgi:hypothetical protein
MNINLSAPLNGLGYGIAGQNILRQLMLLQHEVSLFHIPSRGSWRTDSEIADDVKLLALEAEHNADSYDANAPSVRIWMQNDLAPHVGRGIKVGFPFFELTRFTEAERHHLAMCDRLFVASGWAKQILENKPTDGDYVHDDIRVVPLGVDRDIFNEAAASPARLASDYTVFVNVGKWEIRKGHDVLLAAFNAAFTPQDKVLLRMAAFNPFIGSKNDEWARAAKGSPMGRQIELLERLPNQKSVARLLADADCGVFPARAEGWNLDLLETLSVGTHAIATNYSAHTEYLNCNNARLIDISETESAVDGLWFHGQGNWAKLGQDQFEQLVEHMRAVHRLKQTGQLKRNDAGIETAKAFSWRNTAQAFITGLRV